MANGLDAMSWNQNNNCVAQQPAFIMNVFMAVGVTCVVALHAPRSAPPHDKCQTFAASSL